MSKVQKKFLACQAYFWRHHYFACSLFYSFYPLKNKASVLKFQNCFFLLGYGILSNIPIKMLSFSFLMDGQILFFNILLVF